MRRIRTIKAAMDYIHTNDPESSVTEYFIRRSIKSGALRAQYAGCKQLIDLDELDEFLKGSQLVQITPDFGVIRPIPERFEHRRATR